jgi:hypothetical protein
MWRDGLDREGTARDRLAVTREPEPGKLNAKRGSQSHNGFGVFIEGRQSPTWNAPCVR